MEGVGSNGAGAMVGNLCFVASILSMKNEKVIGEKRPEGERCKCFWEMRMVF